MNKAEFRNKVVPATVLIDGDEVAISYKPRYLTRTVLERLESAISDEANKTSDVLDTLANELAYTLVKVDITDEDGVPLVNSSQSAEERSKVLKAEFDLNTLSTLLAAVRSGVTNPTGKDSNPVLSGSLRKVD